MRSSRGECRRSTDHFSATLFVPISLKLSQVNGISAIQLRPLRFAAKSPQSFQAALETQGDFVRAADCSPSMQSVSVWNCASFRRFTRLQPTTRFFQPTQS
jgi:hypothetical protein